MFLSIRHWARSQCRRAKVRLDGGIFNITQRNLSYFTTSRSDESMDHFERNGFHSNRMIVLVRKYI